MDDGPTITRRGAKQRLDRLVRELCQLIEQLEAASSNTTPAGPMTPHQQSLLWTFAVLVARCDGAGIDGPRLAAECRVQDASSHGLPGPHLRQCLGHLERAGQLNTDVARVVDELKSVLELDIPTLFKQLETDTDLPHSLVHFFERLMAGSDATLRRSQGAYFTPYPLVQYVVRSVDLLLQRELGIVGGLSAEQPELQVVDPACGSGAFLLGVLEQLRLAYVGQGNVSVNQAIDEWLQKGRLAGIDVMPASCGAAELLLEQALLANHSARYARIPMANWSARCTNPLREVDLSRQLFSGRLPVILGNPPYNNFGRRNRDPWIIGQLGEYKKGLGEKKLNLDDDFIKFIRWAQYWIDQAGRGVVALVTNSTYLSGLTHRQMRASLSHTFDSIYVLDLHGSSKRRERSPDGARDENVFPIQQGVAIGLFTKTGAKSRVGRLWHADLWGSRKAKLKALAETDVTSTPWTALDVQGPHHFFVPRKIGDTTAYDAWPRLSEIFQHYVSGVQTKRDRLFVGFTCQEVEQRVSGFLKAAARGEFESDVPQWLQSKAVDVAFDPQLIRPYMVAPLDVRWIYYEPRLLGRARHQLLRHLDADNVALVFMRQATSPVPYDHFLVTNVLVSDRVFYSVHGAPFVAPLYLRNGQQTAANLRPQFLQQLAERLGIPFVQSDRATSSSFCPRDVLFWIYAAVHDRVYRERYHELLRIDFPRIPWPVDPEDFSQLCQKGERLIAAHLRALANDSSSVAVAGATEAGATEDQVTLQAGYPRWQAERLSLSREFVWPERVEAAVWKARIGGYVVLQRWLKQRRGRLLTPYQLAHLRCLIDSLRVTRSAG